MSLNDLTQHIEIQNQAIKSLPSDAIVPVASRSPWEDFRQEFWGKELEKSETVDRGEDPVADDVLPEGPPSGSFFVIDAPKSMPDALGLASTKIVVRSEYNEAEQVAVLSIKSRIRLFIVSGTPGIGKSMFLLWLLIRRLMLQLPTVFQAGTTPHPILFHKNGVYEYTQPHDPYLFGALFSPAEDPSCRIWALFDQSLEAPEPAGLLTSTASPFFIVQAAFPRSAYDDWHKKLGPEIFYMKPWCFSELIQVRKFLSSNPTERQLWYLYDKFGASLRDLNSFAVRPDSYEDFLHAEIDGIQPGGLRSIFDDPRSHPASDVIVTIHPSEDFRYGRVVVPASQHVFQLLLEKHLL